MNFVNKVEKIILKHENEMLYDRVFFDVKEIASDKVEMIACIDGGPLIGKKECSDENEVLSFIEFYHSK